MVAGGVDFELDAVRPTSSGEEELQLQLALAMSKEEHDEEIKRIKGDEVKLQMAIEESRRLPRLDDVCLRDDYQPNCIFN